MSDHMIKRGDRFPYGAGSRQVRGILHYPEAPDPGQIIGPDGMGELCVVLGTIEDRTFLGLAIAPDLEPHVRDLVNEANVSLPRESRDIRG